MVSNKSLLFFLHVPAIMRRYSKNLQKALQFIHFQVPILQIHHQSDT